MSALTTAAIIGLTAATAGAGVAEAAIKSKQTGKAVDAQTDAANKALAVQQQVYGNQQQAAAPYQQAGQQTLGRLGQMAAQPAQSFNPSNYSQGVPKPNLPQMPSQQMPSMGTLGQPPGAPQPGMPTPGGQGDTVTIQTPDGRVLQGFPRARVPEAMQRGAKVMG
jgi:hypothetical protein